MEICRRYRVTGQVQGVFFRASTRDVARRLGVRGSVRNLSDGSVEVIACGDDTELQQLYAWLLQGPPQAGVHQVEVDDIPPRAFEGFEVTY